MSSPATLAPPSGVRADSIGPSPADSLGDPVVGDGRSDLARLQSRHTFVVVFRLVLISMVLGVTTLLYWLADADLTSPASLTMFVVIGLTYLLTIAYSLAIRAGHRLEQLGTVQLLADLAIASVIVHVTGGAQSAYTFFFPVAIIGAALITGRRMTILIAAAALLLFGMTSFLGWVGAFPPLQGQEIVATDSSALELARALALNGAAIIGVSLLAINLGSQLQQARTSLITQTSAADDLRTLHSDIVRSLASGLVTIDRAGQINSINEAAAQILGTPGALGAPLSAVLPDLATILSTAEADARIHRIEVRGGAERVLGVSVSPLFDRKHEPIGRVINFQDLTDLREMETQVRRAERLAVIGRLAAGVAHEIRNPLASISGSIELLRGGPEVEDSDDRTLMDIVTREIDRLNQLITDLLNYTNPGAMTQAELDLAALVADTTAAFGRDPDVADLDLEVDLPDDPAWVSGDSEKLRQVLWNLLRNAAESMGKTGRVRVEVRRDGDSFALTICDNGPGVAPDDVEHLFDPFFTTKEGGTGLGLAIVHSIVTEHGGQISVEKSPGGTGATFRIELTAVEPGPLESTAQTV